MIKCPSCQGVLVKPDVGQTVNCACGQLVYNHPPVDGHDGFITGLYKTCQVCQKFITSIVSFSQHFHDQCYPNRYKHTYWLDRAQKVIVVHELGDR